VTKFLGFLLFLVFVDETGAAYREHIFAPTTLFVFMFHLLFDGSLLKVRLFDLISLVLLLVASSKRDGKGPLVPPMKSALFFVLVTTIAWFLLGMMRGGSARFASWQTYLIFSSVLLAFTMAAVFRTPEHFRGLGKWMVAAALYRALMCWISYFTWGRNLVGMSGAFLTSHEDTVPWIVAILIMIVNAVEKRSVPVTVRNLFGILFIAGAIQFNSRRLAWVSLALAVAVLYFLFPRGAAVQRTVRRAAIAVSPLVLAYVFIGWGRPERIFLPLRSLSSVSTQEDSSTKARNAENLGLIATVRYNGTLTGAGWGRPYASLTTKYDISGFELWPYMPHNSILGLLAFTGIVGFTGFWLAFPTSVFLNARVARLSSNARARGVCIVGVSQLAVCANQLYGDVGIFSSQAMCVIAVSYAIALRMPRFAGVWVAPNAQTKARARPT
jgi:hypothetical protein